LQITTDYRRVLSEILIRRHANPKLGYIFPGYANYQPLDIVRGADLPPDYGKDPPPTATPVLPSGNPMATPNPIATPNPTLTRRSFLPLVTR
jgi:hypothetical protein